MTILSNIHDYCSHHINDVSVFIANQTYLSQTLAISLA